jgi:hypothetical protein
MAAPPPLTPQQIAQLPEDYGPTVVIVSSFFIGLSTVAVALRFAARASRRMNFGWDDWLSAVSLVCDMPHKYPASFI